MGDTIEAVGPDGARYRVRLIGLDCPELGHEKPCARHYAFAQFQHEAMEAGRGLWGPLAEVIHTIVYVTLTGKKYHADGCRYLAQSRIPMSLAEALWRWYGPCTVCKPVFWMPTGVPCE